MALFEITVALTAKGSFVCLFKNLNNVALAPTFHTNLISLHVSMKHGVDWLIDDVLFVGFSSIIPLVGMNHLALSQIEIHLILIRILVRQKVLLV